ncbi:thioredoxin [Actinoplanes sp. L3-i22]|uniref:thioredoxin n=1 Tax=Actinoplanes sp. L3-i22 TaxID=2836373 RepID=UPI001C741186|nr:thioredoxin [Actinoplanes sp. L3-i22]BCY09482.1 thiol reductase thioredoxin [Actinoplanes sp. L3-i22]
MADIVACPACGQRNRIGAAATGKPVCGKCRAALPWIADAGDDTFAAVAEKSPMPVLVDMWAPWCGPCRTVGPALEQVARELAGRVKLVKVDVDQAPGLARRFAVQAVPTLLLLDGGQVKARQSGAAPAAVLRRWVEQSLPTPSRP